MSSEPNQSLATASTSPESTASPESPSADSTVAAEASPSAEPPAPAAPPPNMEGEEAGSEQKPRIKIGTQRTGVSVPKIESRHVLKVPGQPPRRDQQPPGERPQPGPRGPQRERDEQSAAAADASPLNTEWKVAQPEDSQAASDAPLSAASAAADEPAFPAPQLRPKPHVAPPGKGTKRADFAPPPGAKVQPPNIRAELSPDLAREMEEALGDMSIDDLMPDEKQSSAPAADTLEPESKHSARVLGVHRDNVFVEFGGRSQGIVPLKQFAAPPEAGQQIDVVVARFNHDEGIYELTLVGGAVNVGDWSEVAEGMVVEARITGHNKGGLECEVSKLRGFIPASQVSVYRVENLEQFVGQKLPCVVTEANAERRNLVLSHRAVLERQQAEAKEKLLAELKPGDLREGIVRSLRDFGAFVDLGGVDGLIHVSQMSWDRVKHPSEVLKEGEKVRVKIQKIDPDTHKISLAYRELTENPWQHAAQRYSVGSKVTGVVSRIMDFGAFVKLEPGVEGLVHISELAHQRVFRTGDIVSEGQEVEAKVMSLDADAQRIGLSIKALMLRPEPKKRDEPQIPEEPETPPPPRKERKTPLKGGLGRIGDGTEFGLKW